MELASSLKNNAGSGCPLAIVQTDSRTSAIVKHAFDIHMHAQESRIASASIQRRPAKTVNRAVHTSRNYALQVPPDHSALDPLLARGYDHD